MGEPGDLTQAEMDALPDEAFCSSRHAILRTLCGRLRDHEPPHVGWLKNDKIAWQDSAQAVGRLIVCEDVAP